MSYELKPDGMYRMPTHFGPRTGPRRGPDGQQFKGIGYPKSTTVSVSFVSNPTQLEALLPPGFSLDSEPIVNIYVTYMKEIEWLAGRGYNVLGVTIPATFHGEADQVRGNFLTVLWENLADPIITGREELGYSKIYCDLPEPVLFRGDYHCTASWLGFKFLDIKATNLKAKSATEVAAINQAKPPHDGTLHYKYMPRTGEWGTADVQYAVLTPAETPNRVVKESWVGEGSVEFHRARWEDMPTQYNIVNALADLEIKQFIGGSVNKSEGGKDLSDQRILR